MAPPRNQDLLRRYQTWMSQSKGWRSNDYDSLWHRMKDLYSGKHNEVGGDQDQLVVNMSFATINVLAPSVSVNNPRFTVNARKPGDQAQAIITEEVINYVWRTYQYQPQFRLCVGDWLVFGHGWLKAGYKFVTEPKVVPAEDNVGGDEGIEDREDKEGNVESELNVLDDRPFIERISPFDMYVDCEARTLEDMRWVAQRIRRPVADVRVDKRYSPKYRKEAQASAAHRFEDDDIPTDRSPTGQRDLGFIDVIEFYDIRRKTYCVFVEGQTEGFLIAPEKMPYAFGHPFLMLRNYEVADEFYPMGELEEVEALQLELNETRTQMMNHRKRFARKYLYLESSFDQTGLAALESDEDNTMVPVNAGEDITRSIMPMPSVGTPPDFYNQSELIQSDMDKVSGVSDYMRGNMPEIRRTATEAAMVQDAQNSRSAEKLARIEKFLGLCGLRVIQLMQQYMTGEQVVRVTGKGSMPVWLTFDKDYIKGEFDFEVEAGSTQPQNETFRRQSAMQMVDAMAPFVQAGVINVPELAKYVLQFGFGVKDPSSLVAGPVEQGIDPMADATAQPPEEMAEQTGPPPGGPPMGEPPMGALPPGMPPGPGAGMPPGPGGGTGLPPEMEQQLQVLMEQLPPEARQQLVTKLGELPPQQRMLFLEEVLGQFAQVQGGGGGGAPPGAGMPPGGPPPGMGMPMPTI